MANAKMLPSGSWICRAYSHTEIVDGKKKAVIKDLLPLQKNRLNIW
jgi:hypothetical protein